MRAELSKGEEMIRFLWNDDDPDYENSIHIYRFNLAFSSVYYYENMMGRETARKYWDNLVRCGFRQIITCVRL